jgi:chromosome partitioning protein
MNANDLFKELFEVSSHFLQQFKASALSPKYEKYMREWGITDVAKMVNRTTQAIRDQEAQGNLPEARKIKNGKRLERTYNLYEINKIREFFGTRPSKPPAAETAIIAIANFKGGVTKSTTSEQQAHSFALKGYRVLYIDGDPQGTSTAKQGKIPDKDVAADQTLLNILIGKDDDITKCIFHTHIDGLDMIPANLSLYNVELVIPSQLASKEQGPVLFYERLHASLEKIKDNYDIIIIDCPPSCGFITMNVLFAANAVLIPLTPTLDDFASTTQFFNMVYETLDRLPKISYSYVRLLISKHQPNHQAPRELVEALEQLLGRYLTNSKMINSEAVIKSAADLKSIFEVTPHPNDRKTFNRAIDAVNAINNEQEVLIKQMWEKSIINNNRLKDTAEVSV